MPKIPMSNRAGMVQHQSTMVHQTGAPGMGFKMDEARALGDLGDRIGRAGGQISHAVMQYANQQAETENTLAATQARSLYKSINSDLETRMTENPNDYAKFGEWAVEADKKYQDGVREFTDRMSPNFRKHFDAEMEGVRAEVVGRRTRTGIQARITADYNLFQSTWKDAALSGDEKMCRFLMDRERGRLISESEYQQKLLDFERLRDSGAARRLVEAGTEGMIDRLKKHGEDGIYTEFPKMGIAYRERLIRVAEANDAQKRSDENQVLVDRLNSGEQVTVEDIDRLFEDKETPEAVKQKNQQRRIVQRFVHAQKSAQAASAREEKREAREEAAFERQMRRDAVDAHEFRLLSYEFDSDPARRQLQYADLRNEILTEYAGDGPAVKRLISQLDETLKAKTKPDSSYKKTYAYVRGERLLDGMKEDFKSRYAGRGESWYSYATNVYNDSKDLKTDNFKMAKVQFDAFMKANPQATPDDVENFLEKMKRDVNWAECDKLMQFWKDYRVPRVGAESLKSGEVERMVKNRTAIFGSDKKFIRWKDGK